ncbi:hypothetical protein E2C01_073522 [Portunus trituberculatus]|uniref:Uncharacterized protein n=1 Tax=Portunus trituberculatus TaxID=210409 RepID=A0A5B7I0W5_PORTR|nr:hypothetical protein [Portunus trituberculatus]
MRKKEGRK